MWRPMAYFLAANVDLGQCLINKIRELNGADVSKEVITPTLFKSNPGLNTADLADFGIQLTYLTKATSKELQSKLVNMRKRRLIRWHVYESPPTVVIPELSMHPLGYFFFTNPHS